MGNKRSSALCRTRLIAGLLALSLTVPAAMAGISVPSDGSDGVFNPTANIEVDLSQAVTGTWSDNNTANAGKGIYDPVKWAVVFKYSSVDIPAGVTVTFKNHPSGAPVVWLVQGDVTIAGIVNLDGKNGASLGTLTEAGPGGFKGGGGWTATHPLGSGHGPGGGGWSGIAYIKGVGGSYATQGTTQSGVLGPVYGNVAIVPLIGGSGGTGDVRSDDGGGGGGAFLMCTGTTVNVLGTISARGGFGYGGGSGGAIRIIADAVTGNGTLNANGAAGPAVGGSGRIRIEANVSSISGTVTPTASTLQPVGEPVIWPQDTIPSLTISQIAGKPAPTDPHTVLDSAAHYATVASVQPITVRLDAKNVPLTWNVILRVVPFSGPDFTVNAINVSGDAMASVWEATVTTPMGASAFQARASKP